MFKDFIKNYEKNTIIISVLMLLVSLCLILSPFGSAVTVIWMFGIFTMVDGIIHMVSYFSAKYDIGFANFEFAEGIMELLAGFLIYICASDLVLFMPIVIGAWIILNSITKMQISLNMRNFEGSGWVLVLILSIITLFIGVFIILNQFPEFVSVTITILGIFLAVYEVINIIEAIYMLYELKD